MIRVRYKVCQCTSSTNKDINTATLETVITPLDLHPGVSAPLCVYSLANGINNN